MENVNNDIELSIVKHELVNGQHKFYVDLNKEIPYRNDITIDKLIIYGDSSMTISPLRWTNYLSLYTIINDKEVEMCVDDCISLDHLVKYNGVNASEYLKLIMFRYLAENKIPKILMRENDSRRNMLYDSICELTVDLKISGDVLDKDYNVSFNLSEYTIILNSKFTGAKTYRRRKHHKTFREFLKDSCIEFGGSWNRSACGKMENDYIEHCENVR